MEKKFNCWKCKYRGEVPGSCHISCKHPSIEEPTSDEKFQTLLASVGRAPAITKDSKDLNIVGSAHGKRSGWFNFPYDFDPVWLENCDGFALHEKGEVAA